ncbi:class I SAM-dependent methyltransferase [Nanoarchaeota archaeon]
MQTKYIKLKQEYDNYSNELLSKGKLAFRSTSKGLWGPSISDEIFELFQKMNLHKHSHLLDLGSGDGRVAHIASLFTKSTGIEIDDELHDKANEIKEKHKLNSNLIKADFYHHNISDYDVVFINPDTPFYRGLEDKMKKELNGKLIVYDATFRPTSMKLMEEFTINGTKISVFENKRD